MPHALPLAAVLVLFAQATATPTAAQVINGESTYEDNFLHQRPVQSDETHASGGTHAQRPADDRRSPAETR